MLLSDHQYQLWSALSPSRSLNFLHGQVTKQSANRGAHNTFSPPKSYSLALRRLPAMAEGLEEIKNTAIEPVRLEPDHLILLVNGLFGHMDNWKVVKRSLESTDAVSRVLMLASNKNRKLQTFDGIDTCGKRLAAELKETIRDTPSLKYISVFGHSMGGLIARHALGTLYKPESKTIEGLEPRHFITLATPHLGCGGRGPAQVPFIKWFSELPVVGTPIGAFLRGMSNPFADHIMRRTGSQFFLIDGDKDTKPLLVRMAEDSSEEPFLSSLKAFATRTCIANSQGDHLVGWANASIRAVEDLPDLGDVRKAKGIVRADDASSAFWPPDDEALSHSSALCNGRGSAQAGLRKRKPSAKALDNLRNLQSLPWCRMDCSFKGTKFPFFAHNLIQVTREWINWEGESVTQEIADHFCKVERLLNDRNGVLQ